MTYQHIYIQRLPVAPIILRDPATRRAYDLAVQREERLADAAPALLAVLTRILYAHDTGNCGAVTGEAILCGQFASAARDAINEATGGAA